MRNEDSGLQAIFKEFADELLKTLKSIMETSLSTMPKLRENMWMQYARVRACTLPPLWKRFLQTINFEECCSEPLVMELVNESILDSLIKATFPQLEMTRATPTIEITEDEENILRYVCSYIAMKLKHKFLKIKSAQFVECLSRMENDGPTTSFLDYTQEWVKKVNRGGLFVISDEAYRFFVSLELASRRKLQDHLIETATNTLSSLPAEDEQGVSALVTSLCEDDDTVFYWTLVGMDEEHEDSALELLSHMYISIRGFGLCKTRMEEYKVALTTTTKKKKGLRKQLKL